MLIIIAAGRARNVARSRTSEPWTPDLCKTCPVPAILQANACPNMILEARVRRRFGLLRRVVVEAFCTLTKEEVAEPMVGCGHCHEHRPGAGVLGLEPDKE
jgi:hypothetical protein